MKWSFVETDIAIIHSTDNQYWYVNTNISLSVSVPRIINLMLTKYMVQCENKYINNNKITSKCFDTEMLKKFEFVPKVVWAKNRYSNLMYFTLPLNFVTVLFYLKT